MSALKQKLVDIPQAEDSGANTQKRYAYQTCFGLALVLERHAFDGDYAVVFEFHDDIAMFDDSAEPISVRFYQVKTKAPGAFTPADVTKKRKTKDGVGLSVVGKMYRNIELFGDAVEAAILVSNAGANFSKGSAKICFKDCEETDLKRILKRLEEEYPDENALRIDLLHFQKCDLSLDDMDNHTRGKLDAFVNVHLGEVEFSVGALYRAIHEEVSRKAKATTGFSDFAEVVADRGVTRVDADRWLETAKGVRDYPKWDEIAADVDLPPLEKPKVRKAYNSFRIEVLNPNEAHRQVRRCIAEEILKPEYAGLDLGELATAVSNAIATEAGHYMPTISASKLKAMVIYETFTEQQD